MSNLHPSFLFLSQKFKLAETRAGTIVYNISNGERFRVNKHGLSIIKQCDGTKQKDDIVGNETEGEPANAFIENLKQLGVIRETDGTKYTGIRITKYDEPIWAVWNVTNQCNLYCKHCYVDAGGKKFDELSTKEAKKVVDGLTELGIHYLVFSGGEPLIRKDIFEIMAYTKNKSIGINILTNGTLINEEVASKIAEISPQIVQISLESHVSSIHDEIRGKSGAFKGTIDGIKYLKSQGTSIEISTVLTKQNADDLIEMGHFIDTLNVGHWKVGSLFRVGRANENEQDIGLSLEESVEALFRLDIAYSEKAIKTPLKTNILWDSFDVSTPSYRTIICGGDIGLHFYIMSNGDVLPCDRLSLEYSVGNLREKSVRDLWFSENMQRFKLTSVQDIEKCDGCNVKNLCGAGCRVIALQETGDLYGCDPVACQIMAYYSKNRGKLRNQDFQNYFGNLK